MQRRDIRIKTYFVAIRQQRINKFYATNNKCIFYLHASGYYDKYNYTSFIKSMGHVEKVGRPPTKDGTQASG